VGNHETQGFVTFCQPLMIHLHWVVYKPRLVSPKAVVLTAGP
jgi:hypothetical protein